MGVGCSQHSVVLEITLLDLALTRTTPRPASLPQESDQEGRTYAHLALNRHGAAMPLHDSFRRSNGREQMPLPSVLVVKNGSKI